MSRKVLIGAGVFLTLGMSACGAYKQIQGQDVAGLASSREQVEKFSTETPAQDLGDLKEGTYTLESVHGEIILAEDGPRQPVVIAFDQRFPEAGKDFYSNDPSTALNYSEELSSPRPVEFSFSNELFIPTWVITKPGELMPTLFARYSVSFGRSGTKSQLSGSSFRSKVIDLRKEKLADADVSRIVGGTFLEGKSEKHRGGTLFHSSVPQETYGSRAGYERPYEVYASVGSSRADACELQLSYMSTREGGHMRMTLHYRSLECVAAAIVEQNVKAAQAKVVSEPAVVPQSPPQERPSTNVPSSKSSKKSKKSKKSGKPQSKDPVEL